MIYLLFKGSSALSTEERNAFACREGNYNQYVKSSSAGTATMVTASADNNFEGSFQLFMLKSNN